jgi:hypothetical protein
MNHPPELNNNVPLHYPKKPQQATAISTMMIHHNLKNRVNEIMVYHFIEQDEQAHKGLLFLRSP